MQLYTLLPYIAHIMLLLCLCLCLPFLFSFFSFFLITLSHLLVYFYFIYLSSSRFYNTKWVLSPLPMYLIFFFIVAYYTQKNPSTVFHTEHGFQEQLVSLVKKWKCMDRNGRKAYRALTLWAFSLKLIPYLDEMVLL